VILNSMGGFFVRRDSEGEERWWLEITGKGEKTRLVPATAELMLAQILEQREGVEAAQSYVTRQLERHPTMRVFHKLMDYHLNEAEEGRAKESLGVLRNMVGEQVRSKPRYRCQKCGFTAHTLYWHCPSCRSWSTIKPIRGLDGQ